MEQDKPFESQLEREASLESGPMGKAIAYFRATAFPIMSIALQRH